MSFKFRDYSEDRCNKSGINQWDFFLMGFWFVTGNDFVSSVFYFL